MSFVRSKEIPPGSGNWYDYEVRNIRENGKVKQKVVRYVGKSTTLHTPRTQRGVWSLSCYSRMLVQARVRRLIESGSRYYGRESYKGLR